MACSRLASGASTTRNEMVRAIFFDRDGVLTRLVPRPHGHTAPWCPEEFQILPRVGDALALTRSCFKHFVITNQPDVDDGHLELRHLYAFHQFLTACFDFDEILYSLSRTSPFYKPRTGMIDHLVAKYNIDVDHSFLIGDSWKDIMCGHNSGLTTIFIGSKYEDGETKITPQYYAADVYEACRLIMELVK